MIKKKTASFLFLILICAISFAQTKFTLSGTVTDREGEPIVAVAVALKNTISGTYTDEKGHYSLSVKAGEHLLIVSMVGYETQEQTVKVFSNKKVDLVLKESSVHLESAQVYGKSRAQLLREGAYAVNAMNVKPLVNTTQSLSAIVNRTTGVRIREEGGGV